MRKCSLFLATALFGATVFSCTPDKEDNGWVNERPQAQEQEVKGVPPRGNPIDEMNLDPKYTWADVDAYYSESIAGTDYHYTESLKSLAFFTLMQKDFDKLGSPERRLYHIEEQLSLKTNFANFYNFYFLLVSCSDFMSKEEANEKAMRFYAKNQKAIERAEWKNEELKNEKRVVLSTSYKYFYSKINPLN